MAISLRLKENAAELFRNYAKLNDITTSELVRQSIMNSIDGKCDLRAYEKAIQE